MSDVQPTTPHTADDLVLQRSDVPTSYRAVADDPGTGLNLLVRKCLGDPTPTVTAASDNFVLGQELAYSFAEVYRTAAEAQSALATTSTPKFERCVMAADPNSTGVDHGPPLADWSVTRYLFRPILANTTFSYFDLAVAQRGDLLLFLLDRKRGGEFPTDLRLALAQSMMSHASSPTR